MRKTKKPRLAVDALMHDVIDELYSEVRSKKERWIDAAREAFEPSNREPCNICKKYPSLSQAHHVIPLSLQFDRGFEKPDDRHVWLCPTHHAAAHILIAMAWKPRGSPATRGTVAVINDMTHEEVTALLELVKMSGFGKGS